MHHHVAYRFDAVLIRSMAKAFEAVVAHHAAQSADTPALRATIARGIIDAARAGERNRQKLERAGSSYLTTEQRLPVAHRSSS